MLAYQEPLLVTRNGVVGTESCKGQGLPVLFDETAVH